MNMSMNFITRRLSSVNNIKRTATYLLCSLYLDQLDQVLTCNHQPLPSWCKLRAHYYLILSEVVTSHTTHPIHVAHYPEADPAYQVVSERDNPAWRRPKRCPQKSWLQQVDASCWQLLSMDRESAWRFARHDYHEWRHRVGEVMSPGICPPYEKSLELMVTDL